MGMSIWEWSIWEWSAEEGAAWGLVAGGGFWESTAAPPLKSTTQMKVNANNNSEMDLKSRPCIATPLFPVARKKYLNFFATYRGITCASSYPVKCERELAT